MGALLFAKKMRFAPLRPFLLLIALARSIRPAGSGLNLTLHLDRLALRASASRKRISGIVTSGSLLGTCQWHYKVQYERNHGVKDRFQAARLHTLSMHRTNMLRHGDIVCVSPQFLHELQVTVLPSIRNFTRVIVVVLDLLMLPQ